MEVWLIIAVAFGSCIISILLFRFVFIYRRIYIPMNKNAEPFGTMGPASVKQKMRHRRPRLFVPAVLTPGSRLNCGIRQEKRSFNFITHFALFKVDLDEMDDCDEDEEVEIVNKIEEGLSLQTKGGGSDSLVPVGVDLSIEKETIAAPDQHSINRFFLMSYLCPCWSPNFKVGASNEGNDFENDLQSVSSTTDAGKAHWLGKPQFQMQSDTSPVLLNLGNAQDSSVVPSMNSSFKNDSLSFNARLGKQQRKKQKEPTKSLSTRERISKFVDHMKKKSLKRKSHKKRNNESNMMSQSIDSDSFDDNNSLSLESSALPNGQQVTAQANELFNDNMSGNELSRDKSEIHRYIVDEDVHDFPETQLIDEFYLSSNDNNLLDSSQYLGLTVGYHTTLSNACMESTSRFAQWSTQEVTDINVPVVNSRLANYRKIRRQKFKQDNGVVDYVTLNSGPPNSSIPAGYEIDSSICSMDENLIASQWCMYYFDEDNDKIVNKGTAMPAIASGKQARGWYIGYLIGRSMRGQNNYHIRFEVAHTKNLKINGLYKLDLEISGKNAYGRKWIILKSIS